MLNPFPELLVYGVLAPLMLRIALGAGLIVSGVAYAKWRDLTGAGRRGAVVFGVFQILLGACLVAGAWTQPAAFLSAITTFSFAASAALRTRAPFSKATYVYMLIMALSLVLTGAGAFAFDIPL